MANKNGGKTKKDSGRRIRRQTEGTTIASGLGQRPGRSPANREINLRLRRSQRLQSMRPELLSAPPPTVEEEGGEEEASAAAEGYSAQIQGAQTAASTSSPNASAQISSAHHEPSRARRPIPPDWKPPLAIGQSLGDNLSRLEEAERSVLQWEAIVENARITQPLADLSGLEQQLHKARQIFSQMEDTHENLMPVDELETTKRQRIQQRISLLEASLERSECPVGDINIRAAIQAYQSGRIKCWDKWTLLYAGNVVDFCPSYESFTLDRDERLDRYHSMHGDGWLWYEAPLAPKGNYQPEQLMAATWAQPSGTWGVLADYHAHAWSIHMGFQRVKGFHSRFASRLKDPNRMDTGKVLQYETRMRERGTPEKSMCFVEDDNTAPRVCFFMQLDSGATHPSLHKTDIAYLAIDSKTYPAQTHTTVVTASSTTVAALYEIRVDICRHNGESLVGEEPVFPNARRQVGGIVPVMVLVDSTEDQSKPLSEWYKEALENGEDVSEEAIAARYKGQDECRLSGMLPFQVCYFSGAPGAPTFWFGEDRRDVLGADRMPGHQRWERHKEAYTVELPAEFKDLDRPTVIFEHQGNGIRLLDRDSKEDKGTSMLSIERQVALTTGETQQKRTLPEKGSSIKSATVKRRRKQ